VNKVHWILAILLSLSFGGCSAGSLDLSKPAHSTALLNDESDIMLVAPEMRSVLLSVNKNDNKTRVVYLSNKKPTVYTPHYDDAYTKWVHEMDRMNHMITTKLNPECKNCATSTSLPKIVDLLPLRASIVNIAL
jgi:hypothetical protein